MASLLCIYAFYDGIFLCLFLYAFSSCGGDCDGGLCGGDRDGGNGGGGGDHLYLVGRTLHCIREGLERKILQLLPAKQYSCTECATKNFKDTPFVNTRINNLWYNSQEKKIYPTE